LDICIAYPPNGPNIILTAAAAIYSTHFKEPHGLDFIDEETIIVANRAGDLLTLKLPSGKIRKDCYELDPTEVIHSGGNGLLHGPGSVSISRINNKLCEALICNNYSNSITTHLLKSDTGWSINSSEILLQKWLNIPDGVCISRDRQW